MTRLAKASRFAAAAVLVMSAVAFTGGVSGAPPIGSLSDNGNGTVTLNFEGTEETPWFLTFLPSGTACPTGTISTAEAFAPALYLAAQTVNGPAPLLVEPGFTVQGTNEATTLPAGEYELCLYTAGGGGVALVFITSLAADIGGAPEPTTTTTTTPEPTTTTTAPVAEPSTPRFTG